MVQTCDKCERAGGQPRRLVSGEWLDPPQSDQHCLLVLGHAPGSEENEVGRPMIGRSGLDPAVGVRPLLRNTFKGTKVAIWLDNLTQCHASHDPTQAEIKSCTALYLIHTIKRLATQFKTVEILCLGKQAGCGLLRLLTGKAVNSSVAALRAGSPHRVGMAITGGGLHTLNVWTIRHPASVVRSPTWAGRVELAGDLCNARNSLLGINQKCRTNLSLPKGVVCVDTETMGLDPFKPGAKMVGFGFNATPYLQPRYPCTEGNTYTTWRNHLGMLRVDWSHWTQIVLHNAMFDLMWLYQESPQLQDYIKSGKIKVHDTYIASVIAWPFEPSHSLQMLSVRRTNQSPRPSLGAVPFANPDGTCKPEWLDRMDAYLKGDVEDTVALYNHPDIQRAMQTNKYKHTMYALVAAAEIRFNGERIDKAKAAELAVPLTEQIVSYKQDLWLSLNEHCTNTTWFDKKGSFRVKRFKELLFNELKLPVYRRTQTGPSLDRDTLGQLLLDYPDHPILKPYAGWKKVKKLKEDYIDRFVNKTDADGRIHPQVRIAPVSFRRGLGAGKSEGEEKEEAPLTGRWSKADPPRDQIPRSGGPVNVRPMFVPTAGSVFLTVDISQMEHFIGCFQSGDLALIEFTLDPTKDIHQWSADLVSNAWDIGGKCPRQCGKSIVYSSWFGALEPKILEIIHQFHNPEYPAQKADEVYRVWHAKFPGVRAYQIRTLQECINRGMIAVSACGHDRFLDISLPRVRNEAEFRDALEIQGAKSILNHDIQSIGGYLGQAMLVEGCRAYPDLRLVNATHDSGTWEAPSIQRAREVRETFSKKVLTNATRHVKMLGWKSATHSPGVDIQIETRWYAGDLEPPLSYPPQPLE